MDDGLWELLRQYSALVPRRRLHLPPAVSLDADSQKRIHEQVLGNPTVVAYPPPREYTLEFLKWLVGLIERSGEEVHEELVASQAKLWQCDASEEEDLCYKTYWMSRDLGVTLLETRAFISHGTTGLTSWEAAMFFCEYMLQHPAALAGKRVLELGCGVGLVSTTLARVCGPARIICTDASPLVLSMLERNLSLNGIKHAWLQDADNDAVVRLDVLDWTLATAEQLGSYAADVVIATDVMYDPAVAEPLARVLASQLVRDGTFALVAYTLRNSDTVDAFVNALANHKLRHTEIATESSLEQALMYDRSFAPLRLIRIERAEL